jgi:thymidylate synthase (FAD)
MNLETAPKLLRYLVKNQHWSPFEMVSVAMEIVTTRDIARQILRHRSFSFQEFSQRYATIESLGFELSEARLQDAKNRQASNELEEDDPRIQEWIDIQNGLIAEVSYAYNWALDNGIAKEVARKALPEGLTNSRLYMAGTLRSWIHYILLRREEGTQKEHRQVALDAQAALLAEFPSLSEFL